MEVTINGRTLQYQTFCDSSELGDAYWTEFYEGTEIKSRKKYLFFGPVIEKEVPKLIFIIYEDLSNERITKGWWREKILHELELLERRDQLKRGELC